MAITLRKAGARGHANHGWLESWHSFSFAGYRDPAHVHFRSLRVINEDIIQGGEGFGTHPHDNMEIITYILSGALSHKDSMGNGSTIHPGEVQAMSAGTGITHSEFNGLKDGPTHLLQIWIMPHTRNVTPSYSERKPDGSESKGWVVVASERGKDGGVPIYQDARLYLTHCAAGDVRDITLPQGRYGYVHIATGEVDFGGQILSAGDAVMFDSSDAVHLKATQPSEILWFDLA